MHLISMSRYDDRSTAGCIELKQHPTRQHSTDYMPLPYHVEIGTVLVMLMHGGKEGHYRLYASFVMMDLK